MRITWAAIVCVFLAASAFGLDIGDKAPPLTIAKWVRGEAVSPDKPDGKTTYVIDFWATWAPPVRKSIPFLNQLQERYKDRGLVVVGVTDEEVAAVEKFVEGMKMDYRIAVDDQRKTYKGWMEGINAIPYTFVVSKDGIVVWASHPMAGLADIIGDVLAGNYDAEKAKVLSRRQRDLDQAEEKGEMDKALAALDELIKAQPKDYSFIARKVDILRFKGDHDGIRKTRQEAAAALAGSDEGLNNLAWEMLLETDLSLRDPALALKCAEESVRLTNRKSAPSLDTLARAYFEIGLLDQAIAIQKEAIAAARDDDERESVSGALKYYEAAKTVRDSLSKKE